MFQRIELFSGSTRLTYEMMEVEHRQRRISVLGDVELVRAAQNGDAVSLGVLLERYQAALYALALRMLGHGPQAQDVLQDTFLIALVSIDRLREPEAVGAWLRGILRNLCFRRLRERRREFLFDQPLRPLEERSLESPTEEAIDRLAMREWVSTALSELPEVLRVTAILRYFGSYSSYKEISTILGVPVGTVRSRLNQVKIKLAEALLKTAGLAHDEARRLTESETHFYEAAWDEYNRGQGYELFASVLSEEPAFVFSDGAVQGRGWLVEEFEGDLEAGMKLHLTNVIASKDVTVVEGDYENPPDNPFRCPPAISMVSFYRDGRIPRMHLYLASLQESEYEVDRQKP
jgi:RNA polymerase sigma factor (sigma-70 family)